MIEEVIQVISSEQKMGVRGAYLEVTYIGKDGKERKKSIFDQSWWNLHGDGAWVKWSLEKEGNWWNVKSAESVKENLNNPPPPTTMPFGEVKEDNLPREKWEQESVTVFPTTKPAPQEVGMFWKVLTDLIISGQIDKDYPRTVVNIKSQFYSKLWKVTGVNPKEKGE